MEDAGKLVTYASITGALVGVLFSVLLKPQNNYAVFIVVFALIGIILANVALLIIYGIYANYAHKTEAEENESNKEGNAPN